MEKETSDEMVRMKVRNFIALLISLVVGTNSFSIIYQKVLRTEEKQVYDRERADKIAERKKQEAIEYYHTQHLIKELEECKNSKK